MEDLIIGEEYTFTGCDEDQRNFGSYTGNSDNLIVGKKYVITNIEIHSWHTKVWLEGVEGSFNSVCFE